MAISSVNIDDFATDEDAKKYISANAEAMQEGRRVRRIFLLTGSQKGSSDIEYVLREHARALTPSADTPEPARGSGVKWLLKKHAGEDQTQDFALFYPYVVVRQWAGGAALEVCQRDTDVDAARVVFDRLWAKQAAEIVHLHGDVGKGEE